MKFTISSKTLLAHLSAVSKVVNSKNTIAILDNFLFTLKNNVLIVTGTDKENTIISRIELMELEGEGSFAVNVKRLLDLLKELPDQNLTFEINEDNYEIHLQYMSGDYKFVGISGDEFPRKEESDSDDKFVMSIPASEIPMSIDKTVFAVSTETLRPIMMGVLWDIKPDCIVFVASDTHKLVRYINSNVKPGIEGSFILPAKPASILSSILSKEEGNVTITLESKCVSFETETYTLICQYINGKYPNYNAVIPQNNPYEITVDRAMLLNAVKRVAVFSSGSLVKMRFTENKIYIDAQDMDYSLSAKESLDCEYSGEEITVGFNKVDIINVLGSIDIDNIMFKLSDPVRPGLFVPVEQRENDDWLALVMPMMIPNA